MKVLFFAAHYRVLPQLRVGDRVACRTGAPRPPVPPTRENRSEERRWSSGWPARYPGVTSDSRRHWMMSRGFFWRASCVTASDYIRFHDEAFAAFRKTRLTLRDRIPRIVLWLMDAGLEKSRSARRALGAMLRAQRGASMPISEASREFIDAAGP